MFEQQKYRLFIQQYKNKIYTYSLYMLRNRMDADDVTQEVMIRIWKNIDKFNFLAARTWIMKTTNNLCIDYLRKRKQEFSRISGFEEEPDEQFANNNSGADPLLMTHYSIFNEKAREAVNQLPEKMKSVFVLYQLEGLKYREISIVLDLPLNSIKVYLLRARINLQQKLKEYDNHGLS